MPKKERNKKKKHKKEFKTDHIGKKRRIIFAI